jgi:hypothetical protein
MNNKSATLILIYNADGGLLNALKDGLHKLLYPASYPCSLCALTYGVATMKGEWRRFLDGLGMPHLFLYRDELRRDLGGGDLALPAILLADGPGEPAVLVSAAELNALPDCGALIALVAARLASRRSHQ